MKRSILALLLCALMLVSLTACMEVPTDISGNAPAVTEPVDTPEPSAPEEKGQPVRTINLISGTAAESEYSDDIESGYEMILYTEYPRVLLYDRDENNFPGLQKAFEENYTEDQAQAAAFMEENREYVLESQAQRRDAFLPFESRVNAFVRRADTTVTSILQTGFTYTGGAHGYFYFYGRTYNTQTGEVLALTDVVTDTQKLADAVIEQLGAFWSTADLYEDVNLREILQDENNFSWTMEYNGITVYFAPYTIAPYAAAAPTATLSFAQYPDLVREEYQNVPEAYGIQLTDGQPFYYDVTGDGKVDEIIFLGIPSMEGDIGSICIDINGTEYAREEWFYNASATFLHTKDGKNYIYAELTGDNDQRMTVCFDLSNGVTEAGSFDGGLRCIYHEDGSFLRSFDVLTNPNQFVLETTTYVLSTVTGHRVYRVGKNGLPLTGQELFTFDEERQITLTLLQDLDADVYSMASGETEGTKTLYAGDEVLYYSTNNENHAYLQCADGSICRVEVSFDENLGQVVNGKCISETFDGMIFAG